MKTISALAVFSLFASLCVFAQDDITLRADRIAIDNVTKAGVATGKVEAVCGKLSIRGEMMERDAAGTMRFGMGTSVTTCTNAPGHTHWNLAGEVEYQAKDHVQVRDAWLTFYGLPVLYLPYFWYPLDTDCGFSWMVGWTQQWGAYVMTKTRYHLLGDPTEAEGSYWLKAATLIDFREKPGLGLGEDFEWNLAEFGDGSLSLYHAWDKDRYNEGDYDLVNQGSPVGNRRWGVGLKHRWYPSERDSVRVRGVVYSDSYFREDFTRDSFFTLPTAWFGYSGNELVWEHGENHWGAGVSVSGPLNEFYSGLARLPELYFDVNPQPFFSLPLNYESETRLGYLVRQTAEYRRRMSVYAYKPGIWGDYETFRLDSYHRWTAPFKLFGDILSVVPRFGYRGTYWNAAGGTDLNGLGNDMPGGKSGGELFRSIVEGGVQFSARGTGWVNDKWRHMFEPYADVLAQEAMFTDMSTGRRPYVFDGVENSMSWEDQFQNRGRSLPYSYYGVTPGIRQEWSRLDADGRLNRYFELDVYTALQFNRASWYGSDELHRLAEAGSPNYGDGPCLFIPGVRARWNPDDSLNVFGAIEYNSEDSQLAFANLGLVHDYADDFKWKLSYVAYDARRWDYSSTPSYEFRGSNSYYDGDDLNRYLLHMATLSCECQPLDWLRFGPELSWDIQEGEVGSVGLFIDYLTDCLGFRLTLLHRNKYITYDGHEHKEDFNIGFLIYLRAFGDGFAKDLMN